MPDRCDFTDLPTSQCAHCTGDTLDDVGPLAIRWEGSDREAQFHGRCAHCDARIKPGDHIVCADVNGDGGDGGDEWCLYDHTRSA